MYAGKVSIKYRELGGVYLCGYELKKVVGWEEEKTWNI